ncbi:MAG: fructosamine kinase family protein [Burkholderiales bacterium]|nr:fructosamine kinase family protein [Burkholderiales bacterium]
MPACRTFVAVEAGTKVFCKEGDAAMLDAEVDGLRALARSGAIRVPQVLRHEAGRLTLEWLDLQPPGPGFGERFGHALRRLHAGVQHHYGWHRDNFIGATPQHNPPCDDWVAFFAGQRLRPLAGGLHDVVEEVIAAMPRLFDDGYVPRPALIHGDLWSGNWGMLADGTPVIFDPAVSLSDPEAELAMMELFGAPPPGFWQGYGGTHDGYAQRRPLYQLYHLLNHAALFGGGYAQQARRAAQDVLRAAP